jgi:hypothetical protein
MHETQIKEETTIVGAASVEYQYGGARIARHLPLLLDLGTKI